MTIELSCKDLGIANCDWTVEGDTPADVVAQAVTHLKKDHNLDMPKPEAILEGRLSEEPFEPGLDEGVRTVVTRMQQALDIEPEDAGTVARPAIGKVTTR